MLKTIGMARFILLRLLFYAVVIWFIFFFASIGFGFALGIGPRQILLSTNAVTAMIIVNVVIGALFRIRYSSNKFVMASIALLMAFVVWIATMLPT